MKLRIICYVTISLSVIVAVSNLLNIDIFCIYTLNEDHVDGFNINMFITANIFLLVLIFLISLMLVKNSGLKQDKIFVIVILLVFILFVPFLSVHKSGGFAGVDENTEINILQLLTDI